MAEIKVNTLRPYSVMIVKGFAGLNQVVAATGAGKVALVTDSNVDALYSKAVTDEIKCAKVHKFVIDAGEKSKNGDNFLKLVNAFANAEFQRGDAVIALGGGVIGDLAGFAAATYMRGIKYIGVPTSLLADVDSSIGGKTAIDLAAGKNLCGAFCQPFAVYINTDCLKTLPPREIKCGMGEVIKYGLLSDSVPIELISAGVSEQLVAACLNVKREIVEEDEFEGGRRMLLNLGHTVGHAVEKLSGYALSHGECVVKGIVAAIEVSAALYGLDETEKAAMYRYIPKDFDLSIDYSADEIVKVITSDKKSAGDSVTFITLKGAGKPQMEKISLSRLTRVLKEVCAGVSVCR